MFKHLLIFTLIPVASINAFDAHDIDIRQTNNKPSKKASKPDLDAIKKCTAIPTGTIGVWDENLSYRASIGGKSGLVIGDSFISNSEIEKISKTNNKDCVFKTQASGRDLYFNIVDDDNKKSIHWSSEAPTATCSTFNMQKPSNKSLTKSLAFLAESIELNTNLLTSELAYDFENNQQPTQNTAIKRSDLSKHKDIIANCQIAYESMLNKTSDSISKNEAKLNELEKLNTKNALFSATNVGSSTKAIKNLNLYHGYSADVKSCVDNLPISKTIRAFGDNQITRSFSGNGDNYIYEAKDGNYYSFSKSEFIQDDTATELPKKSSKEHLVENTGNQTQTTKKVLRAELPNGEKIVIRYFLDNIKNSDGTFTQKESMVFSEPDEINDIGYQKNLFKKVNSSDYVSSIVSNLQNIMSSYTNDPHYNYKNLPKETIEDHMKNFKSCAAMMNKIAPDEKKWNDIAYKYAMGETVLERGIASEGKKSVSK